MAPGTSRKHKSVPWWTQEFTEKLKSQTTYGENTKKQETTQNKERETKRYISMKNQNTRQQLEDRNPNRG
jgi:hypothetical protein